jgi:UDP:flavonoid glycosyltransferase YjiC (YdhE family)
VLLVSSNGAGMGHLTRLMAMARRRGPGLTPLIASMSQAVPVVGDEGFAWEYIPSRGDLGLGPRRWNVLLERRMTALLRRERPAALVFDGTFPYDGVLDAAAAVGGTALVWSRRGMWRPRLGSRQLRRADRFDLVIEPGELASSHDRGATATRSDAVRVGPITLLDADEQVDREQAAAALGVDPARPTALLTLGAGNINDISSDLGRFVGRLLDEDGLQVVLTRPMIADDLARFGDRVHGVSVYPISRYFRAVDFAIAASGYNAFHELVQFGVPTAFVPNTSTAMDDQEGRAVWAEEVGVGLWVREVSGAQVDRAVTALADPARRAGFAARCRELAQPNGAGAAMRAVEELVGLAPACDRRTATDGAAR